MLTFFNKILRRFIMIALVCFTRLTTQKQHEIQLLGLFTTTGCTKGMEFECSNALVNQNSTLQIHKQRQFWYKTNICFRDMKNSSKTLLDTLLPLATDEREHFIMKCQNENHPVYESYFVYFVFICHLQNI